MILFFLFDNHFFCPDTYGTAVIFINDVLIRFHSENYLKVTYKQLQYHIDSRKMDFPQGQS